MVCWTSFPSSIALCTFPTYVYVADCLTDFSYSRDTECARGPLEPVAIREMDLEVLSCYLVDNLVIMA